MKNVWQNNSKEYKLKNYVATRIVKLNASRYAHVGGYIIWTIRIKYVAKDMKKKLLATRKTRLIMVYRVKVKSL